MNSAPGLLSVMGESGGNPDGPKEGEAVAGPNQYLPMKRNSHYFDFQAIEDNTKGGLFPTPA